MTFSLLDIHNWEETGWASLYSSAGRTSNGNWPMDHWVSVLSFLILAGPGKDLMILFRDCGFFFGGGFWILDFLSRWLPLQVNMEELGHQKGWLIPLRMVNPSQDDSITPGFTHFWALIYSLLPGPWWQTKEVIPCKSVNAWWTQRSMGNSQACCTTEKLTPAWMMTHKSCLVCNTRESPCSPIVYCLSATWEGPLYSCHFLGLLEFHKGPSLGL